MTDDEEFGSLARVGDASVLRFRRRLCYAPRQVWEALTEDGHLAAWFPTSIEGERAAGAPLRFTFRQGEGDPFEGEMRIFEPPSVMELRWADDVLRFELEPDDDRGCLLSLTVTFPEQGKAARDAAGWHVCLERLGYVVEHALPPWDPSDRWREVHAGYLARLGPEASTVGPPEAWQRAHGAAGSGDQ